MCAEKWSRGRENGTYNVEPEVLQELLLVLEATLDVEEVLVELGINLHDRERIN